MKIELTKDQVYNLMFELLVAQAEEKDRLERCLKSFCSKETIAYQERCIKRTEELIQIIDNALMTPFE